MIPVLINVERSGISVKAFNEAQKKAFRAVGEYWHQHILPQHFTHAGARRYGYQRRSRRYESYKLRKYGHTYPLVKTGQMKREALMIRDVREKNSRVKVFLHGPKHLWQFRKDYGASDKAKELTAVDSKDEATIIRIFDQVMTEELGRASGARIGRISNRGAA